MNKIHNNTQICTKLLRFAMHVMLVAGLLYANEQIFAKNTAFSGVKAKNTRRTFIVDKSVATKQVLIGNKLYNKMRIKQIK